MPSPSSAQLDLTRRYAKELRRMHAEARNAFRRNELSLRQVAKEFGEVRQEIPAAPATEPLPQRAMEITPGVGHA
jgi:hypothetical protein